MQTIINLKMTTKCNMRCSYCYETHINKNLKTDVMLDAPSIMNRFINLSNRMSPRTKLNFALHGGEPLLMGKKQYKNIISILKTSGNGGCNFKIGMQTNATLIDNDWVNMFKESFLYLKGNLGISVDGSKCINDHYRLTIDGKGTFERISTSMELLKKNNIKFGIIMVIARHNINNPQEVFDYILSTEVGSIKFLPCLNINKDPKSDTYAIAPQEYSYFLANIFDMQLRLPDPQIVSIEPLVSLLRKILGEPSGWCEYATGKCNHFLTIYPNGDIYNCDMFQSQFNPALGNINVLEDTELLTILSSKRSTNYFHKTSEILDLECETCEIKNICCGGCIGVREKLLNRTTCSPNDYCEGKKIIVDHIQKALSLVT